MNRLSRTMLTLCCTAWIVTACGTEDAPEPSTEPSSELRSELSRISNPAVSPQQRETLARDNRAFAFDLYQRLGQDSKENLFYSPLSISQALAMTHAGARGQTEQEMSQALRWTLDSSELHPAFNALDLALASRGQGAKGMDGQGFRLQIANAIWGQRGYNFLSSYLDTLAQNYDAGMHVLDFLEQPEPARQTINKWVEDRTEGKIKELLEPGVIKPNTRLVLTNAIYFNAAWKDVFPQESSSTSPFNKLDGSQVEVPTMSQMSEFAHAAGDGWQAVELDYDGGEVSMMVIVPDAGRFEQIESRLDQRFFDAAVASLAPAFISLTLPKWQAEQKFSMKEVLVDLGMALAMTSAADFSGINGGIEALWISDVIHQARIAVNEKGTEAAAATAVVMVGSGMGETLEVDRPFIYVIRDKPTGSVLFVGRVVDPLG